jgi:hypothetical protein
MTSSRSVKHIMIDIETLSTRPDALVLSVAAVAFTPYKVSTPISCEIVFEGRTQSHRHIDFDTVCWWQNQSREASEHWTNKKPKTPTIDGLKTLTSFINSTKTSNTILWACSPSFDQVILEDLYRSFNLPIPWSPFRWNDVRTLKNLFPNYPTKDGVKHTPLEDCLSQILIVQHAYSILNEVYSKP